MLKIVKTKEGIQLYDPYKNTYYLFSRTSWELIKSYKKYGEKKAIKKIVKLFNISEKTAAEDLRTVLTNVETMGINIENIPTSISDARYAPHNVQFDITPRCNSNCIYCLSSDLMSNSLELPTKKVFNVLEELDHFGLWILTISGGEPLLRNDIFEILDFIEKKEITTWLFTNGTLIDDATAKTLSTFSNLSIQVSLDSSNPEHHDKQRGVSGSFEKTLQGIKNLIKYGKIPTISVVITPINIDDVEKTVTFLHDLGIKSIRIAPARMGAGKGLLHRDQVSLELSQAKLMGKKIRMLNKKYGDSMNFSVSPLLFGFKENPEVSNNIMFDCEAGKNTLYISSNGDVYPCYSLSFPELLIGNITKTSVSSLWKTSDIIEQLRKLSLDDFVKCKTCKIRNKCKGGCRGSAFEHFKSLKAYDPLHCSYFKN